MRRITTRWPFLLTVFSTMLAVSAAADTIAPGDKFRDGASLVSAEGSFKLAFFTPGSSKFRYLGIWYNTISVGTVVWVANRDRPVPDSTGVLSFSPNNGRLVLSDDNGTVYWSTEEATGLPNPIARLLDNGNFVVTGASGGSYTWQSFDYPTDSMLSGMKLGWDQRAGRSRNITAWRSADDPAPGEYAVAFGVHGAPEMFLVRGTTQLWRSGPWNGQLLNGIPEMNLFNLFSPKFYSNANEVYFWWDALNSSAVSRIVVQPTGVVQRLVWMDATSMWNSVWYAPKDRCDSVNSCGPFAVCGTNNLAVCSCLQGFDPRSPRDWYLMEYKDGCVRRTAMDCRNGTDGFVRVRGAKLPDTSAAVVNQSMALEECPAACLRNCSCTAYATANITGGGSGCILWGGNLTDLRVFTGGGQDLFVRLAAADLASSSSSQAQRRPVVAVIVVAAILGVLLVGLMGWCTCRRRRKKRQMAVVSGTTASTPRRRKEDSSEGNGLELPLYDFRTIAAATNNFAPQNKLGEGGFGPVYMGLLGGGQEVAVKRLARDSAQGLDEFKNEVTLITKLQHRNLVRLLGCCIHDEERILVYEYLSNKSLDAFLFDETKAPLLDWQKRYQIIDGVARGLLYLHQDSRLRIIHRDLKASNVLLDNDMNPKISDFGLARMFGGDDINVNTRRIVGTYGYMSPEYAMDGAFSVKSDVFSFGVLLLEIVSGKRNRGIFLSDPNLSLLGHAWSLWRGGNGLELVDSSLAYSFPMAEVLTCIKVGLLCVQERPKDRPTMASVVFMLGRDMASLPQPKQPGFVAIRGPVEGLSSSSTANDVTVTMLEAR